MGFRYLWIKEDSTVMGFRYLWIKEDSTVMGTDNKELAERAINADEFIIDTKSEAEWEKIEEFKDEDFPIPDPDDIPF